jgi:hypothetical protein
VQKEERLDKQFEERKGGPNQARLTERHMTDGNTGTTTRTEPKKGLTMEPLMVLTFHGVRYPAYHTQYQVRQSYVQRVT